MRFQSQLVMPNTLASILCRNIFISILNINAQQFSISDSAEVSLLTCSPGEEVYSIEGVADQLAPGKKLSVTAGDKKFNVRCRIDTPVELAYYQHGGILQYVLRSLAK